MRKIESFSEKEEDYDPRLITTQEAAKLLRVGTTTIIRWIDAGLLPAYRTVGGHRRVKYDNLLKFAKDLGHPLGERIQESDNTPGRKVIIVDDAADIRENLTVLIRGLRPDLEVFSTDSGFEAGLIISRIRPRLVLLDIMMPGLDGIMVCRLLRADLEFSSMKIVGITASRQHSQVEEMKEAGANLILLKPITTEIMSGLLEESFPIEEASTS